MSKRVVLSVASGLVLYGFMASAMHIGIENGLIVALGLAWTFGLGFGANVALTAIMRGPVAPWKALMPALLCFAPLCVGSMPLANWMTMSRFSGVTVPLTVIALPSVLALLGLVAPNGFFLDGIRRLRRALNRRA